MKNSNYHDVLKSYGFTEDEIDMFSCYIGTNNEKQYAPYELKQKFKRPLEDVRKVLQEEHMALRKSHAFLQDSFITWDDSLIRYIGTKQDVVVPKEIRSLSFCSFFYRDINSITLEKTMKELEANVEVEKKEDGSVDVHGKRQVIHFEKPFILYFNGTLYDYCHLQVCDDFYHLCAKILIRGKGGKYVCLQDLKTIKIPDDIKTIPEHLFSYCNMKRVILGKNVKEIQEGAFSHCSHLKEVVFDKKLQAINDGVFDSCTSLGPVLRLPKNTMVSCSCFPDCGSLETIYCTKGKTRDAYAYINDSTHPIHYVDTKTGKDFTLMERMDIRDNDEEESAEESEE